MKKPGSKYIPLLIILLCYISRIPQLASPHLFLDGDECVVAVAAKHIYDGKDISLFFLGQRYGFSLIESLFIVPFYALFGITALAVKLAMLLLWSIGAVFLYKTLVLINKGNKNIPLLLTLVFIWCPAWAIWAMKARGGYLTAFTLTNITTYLLFHPVLSRKLGTWLCIGVLLNFIYQSQMFWIYGIAPLVIYRLAEERNIAKILVTAIPLTLLLLFFWQYKLTLLDGYSPQLVFPEGKVLWEYIVRSPKYFYHSLHGNYYFGYVHQPNFFCAFVSVVFMIALVVLAGFGLYHMLFKRKGNGFFIFSTFFIAGSFFTTLIDKDISGRYLLPVTGFCIFSLQLLLNHIQYYKAIVVASWVLIVSGVVAQITFWDFVFLQDRKEGVLGIVSYLEKHNIKYSICLDTMVPWQLIFYSQERSISRGHFMPGRYTPYTEAVNNALDKDSNTVAVIKFVGQFPEVKMQELDTFYFFTVGYGVSKESMKQMGYYFND